MIEALIVAVIGIVEAILAVLAALIEWVAGFFIAGGEALGAGEIGRTAYYLATEQDATEQ